MKMLKKMLAVVLTGAMALTLLTACGGNAVNDKNIADALNEMAKVKNSAVTFTPRAEERELAKKIAELIESEQANTAAASEVDDHNEKVENILGVKAGGVNANNFVWLETALIDERGVSGQAVQLADNLLGDAWNNDSFSNQKPADTRYMGSALCKITVEGEPVTVRVVVVTAKAEDKK